jgi:hypothetical protein
LNAARQSYRIRLKNTDGRFLTFIRDSELLRVFVLLALSIYVYHPFFSALNIGAADAQFYQYMLHDAIIQLENGFFPTYVGQSLFSPNGLMVILAPYYLLLGQLLNVLSFGTLNPLLIQHLTIFSSALGAAAVVYIGIRNIAPQLRWQALFLAFAYISSPGVMALIFHMDAYFSFMSVPFVPLVFYGLARIYKKNDALAYSLTGSALALVWLAHAPIALWTSALVFVFCLSLIIFKRRHPGRFILTAVLFGLLCAWQFFPILMLGHDASGVQLWKANISKADQVIEQLLLAIPDVFLPLRQGKNGFYFLQLGYSLWFVLVLGVITALRSPGSLLLRLMLALVVILLLFLYPLPGVGRFLWSVTPALVLDITNLFANQRLYVILAACACFVGALALHQLADSASQRARRLVAIALMGLFVWNIYQVGFFVKHGNAVKSGNESVMNPKDSWSSPHNLGFVGFGMPKEYLQILFTGTHAAELKSRLLDSQKKAISAYDNEQLAIDQCLQGVHSKSGAGFGDGIRLLFETTLKEPVSVGKLKLLPNIHYLLCADISNSQGDALFQLLDEQRREMVALEVPGPASGPPVRRKIGIPFFFTDQDNKEAKAQAFDFRVWSRTQPLVTLHGVGVTSYEPAKLPIEVQSYTPYRARVISGPDHKYIEIVKLFRPGYVAKVNGEEAPTIESTHKTIVIPLKGPGRNEIELSYVGTLGMRVSFYISAVSWVLVFIFLIMKLISRSRRIQ